MDEGEIADGVTYYRLMEAIESFVADAHLNPAVVTRKVLANTLSGGGSISVKDLENFMRNLRAFTKEEVNLILWEIRYLQSIKTVSECDDVALLVRDCCERYAK